MRAEAALRSEPAPRLIDVLAPTRQSLPFVYASPHSGDDYPADFVSQARLDPVTLRKSEDSFVDEIFAGVTAIGSPLIRALFPRAYCDPNREPYELDPGMFEDDLPSFANTSSLRVAGGLGVIARVVSSGEEIYAGKLRYSEAESRIANCYRPYHRQLTRLLRETKELFGLAALVDCHSMPSIGGPMDRDQGTPRPDIVLGDRFGTSCAPAMTQAAEEILRDMGYRVARNNPYAGGFSTVNYGHPREGYHALQIELNRSLYMDENRFRRLPGIRALAADMMVLSRRLGELPVEAFAA